MAYIIKSIVCTGSRIAQDLCFVKFPTKGCTQICDLLGVTHFLHWKIRVFLNVFIEFTKFSDKICSKIKSIDVLELTTFCVREGDDTTVPGRRR